jgi:hypothetical protein
VLCRRSSGSLDGSCFLDRIERLAYQDKRTQEAARSVLAEQMHNAECTFRPEINPRSQRMVKVSSSENQVCLIAVSGQQ